MAPENPIVSHRMVIAQLVYYAWALERARLKSVMTEALDRDGVTTEAMVRDGATTKATDGATTEAMDRDGVTTESLHRDEELLDKIADLVERHDRGTPLERKGKHIIKTLDAQCDLARGIVRDILKAVVEGHITPTAAAEPIEQLLVSFGFDPNDAGVRKLLAGKVGAVRARMGGPLNAATRIVERAANRGRKTMEMHATLAAAHEEAPEDREQGPEPERSELEEYAFRVALPRDRGSALEEQARGPAPARSELVEYALSCFDATPADLQSMFPSLSHGYGDGRF
jgi:hypothetical protein